MLAVFLALHLLLAIVLIGLILIQRGKGADIGAAFGSGASQTVFGSRGSASFLTRTTAVLAALFFISSLTLSYFYGQQVERKSVTETAVVPAAAPPDAAEQDAAPGDVPRVPAPEQGSTGATAPAAGQGQ